MGVLGRRRSGFGIARGYGLVLSGGDWSTGPVSALRSLQEPPFFQLFDHFSVYVVAFDSGRTVLFDLELGGQDLLHDADPTL